MQPLDPSQLLACPFCGGPAEVDEHIERVGQNRHNLVIRCSVCFAKMDVTFYGASHSDLVRMHRNRMVEKWNNRAGATT